MGKPKPKKFVFEKKPENIFFFPRGGEVGVGGRKNVKKKNPRTDTQTRARDEKNNTKFKKKKKFRRGKL